MNVASPAVALDPGQIAAGDVARFWRVPRYSGLDCLRATFRRHAYARHTHETFAIAAVLEGCETFSYRGAQHYGWAGSVCVVCPDEPHDGAPYGGHFEYRTLYPDPALVCSIVEDAFGRPVARAPWFREPVIADPMLAAELAALHHALSEDSGASALETDSRMAAFVTRLVARAGDLGGPPPATREGRAVARAREMIDACFAEDLGLAEIAGEVGLSRAHLCRAFKAETGFSPHAYQIDRRFRAACRLLAAGEGPAQVALDVGFYDQSHLNRVFKARMGVTPGAFASSARSSKIGAA